MAQRLHNLSRLPHVKIVFAANTPQLLAWPINLVAFHANLASIPLKRLAKMQKLVNNAPKDIYNPSQENQTAILCRVEQS